MDDIDLLFADEITTNAKVTFADVRNTMKESLRLVVLANENKMVRKVYNRIKYLQSAQTPETLLSLQQENEEPQKDTYTWIEEHHKAQSLHSSRSTREQWDEDDVDAIREVFSKYDERPSKKDIERIFIVHAKLDEIRERKGFSRCYNKVKNMFR